MMDESAQDNERGRRGFIAGIGALGLTAAVATWIARRRRPPQGAPLAIDLGSIAAGEIRHYEWQGRQICVLRRTPEQLAALFAGHPDLLDAGSAKSLQPAHCRNAYRAQRPEWFVAIAECTHQGCTPQLHGESARFVCPCHASSYDLAGRVFRAGPAPANLTIPQYRFEAAARLIVGQN